MNSFILSVLSRTFFGLMLVVSLWVYFRGHNEPGGGFVGGLIAACGFAVVALAEGIDAARAALRIHPMVLVGIGVCAVVGSGIFGLVADGSFLTHQWTKLGIDLSTTMLFDGGVYLVVLGGILALVIRFYEGL